MSGYDMPRELRECLRVAPSPGQGYAAFRTWCVLQASGREAARGAVPRSTWFRHLRVLRDAGLLDGSPPADGVPQVGDPEYFGWDRESLMRLVRNSELRLVNQVPLRVNYGPDLDESRPVPPGTLCYLPWAVDTGEGLLAAVYEWESSELIGFYSREDLEQAFRFVIGRREVAA